MKQATLYLLSFVAIQVVVGAIVLSAWPLISGQQDITSTPLIVSTALCSLLTIVLFLLLRWAAVSPAWLLTKPWTVLAWSVVAAVGLVIPSTWLQELMPQLPDWQEENFQQLLSDRLGYVVIALLAPFTEELVFRGALLRSLLQSRRLSPWAAIALSAACFALVHMNPAQMPHAFLVGLLLGWMYWRTGSILPAVAYHWANNSAAYIVYHMYPDPDITLADIFQGSTQHVLMAVGFSLLIALPAIWQLHLTMRRADGKRAEKGK